MAESPQTKNIPPYVPWRTFENYLESLKAFGPTLPNVIERSSMHTLAGSAQTQLLHALRYLGLIDQAGVPSPRFSKIVHASMEDRRSLYRQLIDDEYPFLEGINLRGATPKQLDDAFATTGATGDSIRKCVAFFVGMSKTARIELSSLVTKRTRRPKYANGTTKAKKRQKPKPSYVSFNPDDFEGDEPSPELMKTILQLPRAGGYLKLTGKFNLPDLSGDERDLVFALIDKMRDFESQQRADTKADEGGDDND